MNLISWKIPILTLLLITIPSEVLNAKGIREKTFIGSNKKEIEGQEKESLHLRDFEKNWLETVKGEKMTPVELLATTLFSETKDLKDAEDIASVIMTRIKNPKRFGNSLEEVIYSPKQFSGVGSNEWNKVANKKITPEEEGIYKQFLRISNLALTGKLKDRTGGADHYYNPQQASPDWGKLTTPEKVKSLHYYYKPVHKNDYHSYFKETLRKK